MAVSVIICIFAEMKRNGSIYCLLCLSVLWLMVSCAGNGAQMRQQLEALEQQNVSGESMLNDSLAESLVSYFDKHGDANERMRARYILGRTYYCLGELPRALETYCEAADCADTTATDCDFAKLSRIHAQSAQIFRRQIQPRTQLRELMLAEHYAWTAKDTLMAVECMEQRTTAYSFLKLPDSVIAMAERTAQLFLNLNKKDRYAQTLGTAITPLVNKGDTGKAKRYLFLYEQFSGFFNENGKIDSNRIIFYYTKGNYFLKSNQNDSAEFYFRKLLKEGKTLNHQIAGNKGLQKVYEIRGKFDSIAKYANLGYELNDSAYSLSEMANIQRLQASYNYEHNKLIAEQKSREADRANLLTSIIVIIIIIVILIALYAFNLYQRKKEDELMQYRQNLNDLVMAQTELQELRALEALSTTHLIDKKNEEIQRLQEKIVKYQKLSEKKIATLENRLQESDIVRHLHNLLYANPPQIASQEDFRQLKTLINEEIPQFYSTLNNSDCSLRTIEYEVCLLIRCHFLPAEICKLMDRNESYVANLRKAILQKLYGLKGSPKDLDQRILAIK